MAKRAICDVCRAEGELNNYGSIPDAWFSLRQLYNDEQHLCSIDCLRTAVDARAVTLRAWVEAPAETNA